MDTKQAATNLLADLGLTSLPEEEQALILSEMIETIEDRVLAQALTSISEEEKSGLDKLLAAGDNDGATKWLLDHLPNYPELVEAEVKKYREERMAEFADA